MTETLAPDVLPAVDTGAAEPPADADDSYLNDLEAAVGRHDEGATDDGEADDLQADLREALRGASEDDGERAWKRELNGYLEPHRDALNQLQKGSKEAIRRLFRAEAALRENPIAAMQWLTANYAANRLDPAGRAELAAATLQALGFTHGSQLAENERAQLAQLRQFAAQHQAHERQQQAQAEALATEKIAAFGKTRPHLQAARQHMGHKMLVAAQQGRALDMETAYAEACRELGLSTNAGADHKASIARAKAARTPQTASMSPPATDDGDEGASYADVLRAEFGKERARARR